MLDRLVTAVAAVCLALLVWLYARSRDHEILDNVPVPVEVTLAPEQSGQYSMEVTGEPQVMASFTGAPQRIRELRGMLQRGEVRVKLTHRVTSDRLREKVLHETIVVEPGNLNALAGVTPMLVPGKNQVRAILYRLGERRLPVKFDPSLERYLGPVTVEPATVVVRGPLEVLDQASCITTQPAVLPAGPSGPERPTGIPAIRVPLSKFLEGREVRCQPESVRVRVAAQPRKTYELNDVPVHFLSPAGFSLKPRFTNERAGKISLRVVGPPQEEPPRVTAFVDLTCKVSPAGPPRAGLYEEPIQLQLPRDFQLADGVPTRNVAFELLPLDGPGKEIGDGND